MKKTLFILSVCFAASMSHAAEFIVKNVSNTLNDHLIVYDPVTKMEWLKPSVTAGLTLDEVRTGYWVSKHGFKVARKAQVDQLFKNAYLVDDWDDISSTQVSQTAKFIGLFGATFTNYGRISLAGMTSTDNYGIPGSPTPELGTWWCPALAKVDLILNEREPSKSTGEAHYTGGGLCSGEKDPTVGTFLVRKCIASSYRSCP